MDPSALIFVALAVAWAIYLIPKALKQHEDSAASRTIDGFSDQMRVLARREAVDSRSARLVVPGRAAASRVTEPGQPAEVLTVAPPALTPQQHVVRRAAAARAAQRRLRVVCSILAVVLVVGVVSGAGYVSRGYNLIPVGVLVAWLVACRLMVKRERAAFVPATRRPVVEPEVDADDPLTAEIAVVEAASAAEVEVKPVAQAPVATRPGEWDPVPVTLPTYVAKEPAARRTVRTIDLDSTGVWSSGPSASDSALARGAEESERTAKAAAAEAERRRASGS